MPVSEISVLWLTAGLSCDGDTIAMTAATQPSLEGLLSGDRVDALHALGLEALHHQLRRLHRVSPAGFTTGPEGTRDGILEPQRRPTNGAARDGDP